MGAERTNGVERTNGDDKEYYCMDFGRLPDALYKPGIPYEQWRKHLMTAGKEGFKAGSLRAIAPIRFGELLERLIIYPLYMIMNAAPFMMPPLLYSTSGLRGCLYFLLGLFGVHGLCKATNPMKNRESASFICTERHIQKYNSIKWVWPKSLEAANSPGPKIFCTIPHGLAPVGIVAYPGWARVFGERGFRPTAAPMVLKLPVIGYFLKSIGYIDAASSAIKKAVSKDEHVLIILDGINGMFQKSADEELGYVQERKGIVKIALTTGTPLVPVFGFGHSNLWKIYADRWGILERISLRLGVSVTPFCGRPFGLLPFGPPYRTPIVMAFGEPIVVPKVAEPTKEQIDDYHKQLMDGFVATFEKHKTAYGWEHKHLKLI